jgi:cyclic pyranopterin monophosphate synthase
MKMVDVSGKPEVFRKATAIGTITLKPETLCLIEQGKVAKGDPFNTAKIAGILAAKNTSTMIPLCHPLPLTNVEIQIEVVGKSIVKVTSMVKTKAQTGVEMEALTATAVSLLTIWDMVKQYEKNTEGQYPSTAIKNIHVVSKIKESDTSE